MNYASKAHAALKEAQDADAQSTEQTTILLHCCRALVYALLDIADAVGSLRGQ